MLTVRNLSLNYLVNCMWLFLFWEIKIQKGKSCVLPPHSTDYCHVCFSPFTTLSTPVKGKNKTKPKHRKSGWSPLAHPCTSDPFPPWRESLSWVWGDLDLKSNRISNLGEWVSWDNSKLQGPSTEQEGFLSQSVTPCLLHPPKACPDRKVKTWRNPSQAAGMEQLWTITRSTSHGFQAWSCH